MKKSCSFNSIKYVYRYGPWLPTKSTGNCFHKLGSKELVGACNKLRNLICVAALLAKVPCSTLRVKHPSVLEDISTKATFLKNLFQRRCYHSLRTKRKASVYSYYIYITTIIVYIIYNIIYYMWCVFVNILNDTALQWRNDIGKRISKKKSKRNWHAVTHRLQQLYFFHDIIKEGSILPLIS